MTSTLAALRTALSRALQLVIVIVSVAMLLGVLVVPFAVAASATLSLVEERVIDRPALPEYLPLGAELSTVWAVDGSRMGELSDHERRRTVAFEEVPQHVIDAVLAVEDASFYEHVGVDHRALVRAAVANLTRGGIVQGGSTITQQYVKMVLLEPDQTLERKVHETVWAVELEQRLTKDEILERYLNAVYLGEGVYGFGTAAEHYFSKRLQELTVAEAALLAGAIQAPSTTNPVAAPEAATARRDTVLRLMRRHDSISPLTATHAMAEPTELQITRRHRGEPFAEDLVKRVLYDPRVTLQPEAQAALGDSVQERIDALFRGGIQIETTLDPVAQDQAAASLATFLSDPAEDPVGALISLDHRTGALYAFAVGPQEFGPCPEDDDGTCTSIQTNPAVPGLGGSGRQAGSAFKPFVAATALRAGAQLELEYDTPSGEPVEGCGWDASEPYAPRNFDDRDDGRIDMGDAMRRSSNVYFVKLARDAGVTDVVELAREHGIRTSANLDAFAGPDCSLGLGTASTFPLEMAVAYGVWADDGVRCEPYLIERILDRHGEVLYEHQPRCERVLDAEVAADMRALLRLPVDDGGTAPAVGRTLGPDVWGKTGTTNDFVDAWFVGSTPDHTTAAWVGFEHPRPMEDVTIGGEPFERVTGGSLPARIFTDYTAAGAARALDDEASDEG